MFKPFPTCLLAVFLAAASPLAGAANGYGVAPPMATGGQKTTAAAGKPVSYGDAITDKLAVGAANIVLSPLEVHKNIVNTINEGNLALGITAGVFKGFWIMTGRILAGITDVVSFPLPTEPLTTPKYVWQDYNVETHFTTPLLKMKPLQ